MSLRAVAGTGSSGKDASGYSLEPLNQSLFNIPSGMLFYKSYARTKAALAAVKAGTGFLDVIEVGDSTTAGWYSVAGTTEFAGCMQRSPVQYTAATLQAAGIPAQMHNTFGDAGMGASYTATWDARVAVTGTVAASTTPMFGGNDLLLGNAATYVFTPYGIVDTFDIFYAQFPASTATFTAAMAGASNLNLTNTGANAYTKSTITGTRKAGNALTITATAASVHLAGIRAYDSTTPCVRCINGGFGGVSTAVYSTAVNPWDPLNAILAIINQTTNPCVVKIRLGGVDWDNSVAVATTIANLQAMITAILPVADVWLESPLPVPNATKAQATQQTYVTAMQALCQAQPLAAAGGICFNDVWTATGSQETQVGLGVWSASSGNHPQYPLYQDLGQAVARTLISLAT